MSKAKPKIIQHPSTPEEVKKPELPAEDALAEALPLVIDILLDSGFDLLNLRVFLIVILGAMGSDLVSVCGGTMA